MRWILLALLSLVASAASAQGTWPYYPPPGLTYNQNANNGSTEGITPQSTSGLNGSVDKWFLDTSTNASFASSGALYNDPVIFLGYNCGSLASSTPDPWEACIAQEADYGVALGQGHSSGTSTATTNATQLTDTTQTWAVNQWTDYIIWDSTQGCSASIASNTATILTISGTWTATSGACTTTPTTGDSYQILTRQFETYMQWNQLNGNHIRPWFFTGDKSSMSAQQALGAITVSNMTDSSGTITVTTAVNHGFIPNQWIKFGTLSGGTWNTFSGLEIQVLTVPTSTTFTFNSSTSSYGTFSSGTVQAEAVLTGAQVLMANNAGGFEIRGPSYAPSSSDLFYQFLPGQLNIDAPVSSSTGSFIQLNTDPINTGSLSGVTFSGAGKSSGALFLYSAGSNNSRLNIDLWDTSGANRAHVMNFSHLDTATTGAGVGTNSLNDVNKAIFAITNYGQDANYPLLWLRPAASQSADYIQLFDSTGNTTKGWYVDHSFNMTATAGVNFTGLTTGTNADFLCLSSAGAVLIQSSACTISSERYKDTIYPVMRSALTAVGGLVASSFKLRGENRDPNATHTQIGLIAENVAAAMPECAIYDTNPHFVKSYRQECVLAFLAKAINEQHSIQESALRRQQYEFLALVLALGGLFFWRTAPRGH
jgi:hypothetical protein